MVETIVIVRLSDDGLYQEKWIFSWYDHNVTLQRYQKSRKSGDTWVVTHLYDSLNTEPYGSWVWLRENKVPWDDRLREQVCEAVSKTLKIGKPSDFKKKR